MAKRLSSAWLILALAAVPASADDLTQRLEQLQREAAKRAAEAPPASAAAEAAPANPSPRSARLTEIQKRRAREYREGAAIAARRAAAAESSGVGDPAQIEKDRREGELLARKAEDVFRPGTAEYQAAYDQWLASEASAAPPAPAEPAPEPTTGEY